MEVKTTFFVSTLFLAFIFLLAFFVFCYFALTKRLLSFLFKDLRRKMVMTLCLGGVFFVFYVFLVYLLSFSSVFSAVDLSSLQIDHLVYESLFIFAFLSLLIYLMRMMIKFFFILFGKD